MTEDLEPHKILQLIPAEPGWYVHIEENSTTTHRNDYYPVIALALVDYQDSGTAVEPIFLEGPVGQPTAIGKHLGFLYKLNKEEDYIADWRMIKEENTP